MEKTETKKAIVKMDSNAVISTQSNLKTFLTNPSVVKSLKEYCTKHLTPERLGCMVLSAASRNPLLLKCTQSSLIKAARDAGTLGLDCSGLLGRGYIVAYRNNKINAYEAQFMTGYLGLCDLARRSGEITKVEATAVYDGDKFKYEEGTNKSITHKPLLDPNAVKNKSSLKFVYAVATFSNGEKQFQVMTIPEVEQYRARSRAKDSGPWVTDYVAMAKKTVVRQLCKYLPQSSELAEALMHDNELDGNAFDLAGQSKSKEADLKEKLQEETIIDVDSVVVEEPVASEASNA